MRLILRGSISSSYALKKSPYDFFLKDARLALSDGQDFWRGSEQYARLNFGCPRSTFETRLGAHEKSIRSECQTIKTADIRKRRRTAKGAKIIVRPFLKDLVKDARDS